MQIALQSIIAAIKIAYTCQFNSEIVIAKQNK